MSSDDPRLKSHAYSAYRALAMDYPDERARNWIKEEDDGRFFIGCPDWADRPTMIFFIEGLRDMCAMNTNQAHAYFKRALTAFEDEHGFLQP